MARRPRIPRPPIPEGHGWCTKCRSVKPAGEFARNRTTPTGLAWWCKACTYAAIDDYVRRNRRERLDAQTINARKRRGMTLAEALSIPIRRRVAVESAPPRVRVVTAWRRDGHGGWVRAIEVAA